MKSFIYGLVIVVLLCSTVIAVQEQMVAPGAVFTSSGIKYGSYTATPTTVIISGGGIGAFGGLVMYGNGTNNASLTIYDSAAASSGTVLFRGTCPAASYTCVFAFPWPIAYSNGLVAHVPDVSTPTFVIYYDNRGK